MRTRQGFSIGALALASGVARDLIEHVEQGRFDPDFDLLIALADALGVEPAEFVVRAEELGEQR